MTGRRDTVALKRLRAHRDSASVCRPPPLATAIPPVLASAGPVDVASRGPLAALVVESRPGAPRSGGPALVDVASEDRWPPWWSNPGPALPGPGQRRPLVDVASRGPLAALVVAVIAAGHLARVFAVDRRRGLVAAERPVSWPEHGSWRRSGSPGRVCGPEWGPVCVPSVESSRALNYGPTGERGPPVFLTPADPGRPRQTPADPGRKWPDECPWSGRGRVWFSGRSGTCFRRRAVLCLKKGPDRPGLQKSGLGL